MRVLTDFAPTPEQLKVLETDTYRTCIIRGSAGSGKTSSAALRCRKVLAGIAADRILERDPTPIRLAVLTFNRTLKGYIENFIDRQIKAIGHAVEAEVDTFAGWAFRLVGRGDVIGDSDREAQLRKLWDAARQRSTLSSEFVLDEVDYVLGRFGRAGLEAYVERERTGRGTPTLQGPRKQSIVDDVIRPYLGILDSRSRIDWNDCAEQVVERGAVPIYDAIIADEVQDFTVRQIRAILCRLKPRSSLTLVIDTAQSIYPKHIEWAETGIDLLRDTDRHTLRNNYRNSPQIAQFVQPLLANIRLTEDGTIPDYRNCRSREVGRTPVLFDGSFDQQVAYSIAVIAQEVKLYTDEELKLLEAQPLDAAKRPHTVGILTKWGDTRGAIARGLRSAGMRYCELTRQKEWPQGPEQIGISTLHSAKGLEFDHVFILGFDSEFFGHEAEAESYSYNHLRRLLAMAITRAKKTVVIGYRQAYRSDLLDLFDPNTYVNEPQQ